MGQDFGTTLPDLLNALADVEGDFRLRVGMMNPATVLGILEDLVESFAAGNLFRFIHVPVQSGSDRLLEKMQREYCRNDFESIVLAFRKRFPDISVATDMIVGYPGEEESDFEESLSLVLGMRFEKVNITRYSRRPHTSAYSLADTPESIKKERSRSLQTGAEKISAGLHAQNVGAVLPFLVTEKNRKGSVMARTPSYIGVVLPEDLPVGFFGNAEILEARTYYLKGRRI